jgi:hypothetical protein
VGGRPSSSSEEESLFRNPLSVSMKEAALALARFKKLVK